jgi:membrane-bound lytic murein transglycosylase D
MKRSWPVLTLAVLCVLSGSSSVCQTEQASLASAKENLPPPAVNEASNYLPDIPDAPPEIRDVMRRAQQSYIEGSNLLKSGESAKARLAFNQAVDVLLDSGYDLTSAPVLQSFFRDLLRLIHQDEARYLQAEEAVEEKHEEAVVDELDRLDLIPISIDPVLSDVVAADLANTQYDIPIILNEAVLKSLNYWLGKGRKYFADGLVRSGRYREMIGETFRAESVPLDVMYLAQVESLFKTDAVSRARARGIWQFGRGTAIRYGLKVNRYIDERSDPEKSTRAAARYLSDLYAMFKDWNLVLAAYNWGEGKVLRLINKSGRTDFWDLLELKRNFPKETKNHVPLIMASIILARNPEKYGLPTELDRPLVFDRVSISKPTDLKAAARLVGLTAAQLKELNPALRGLTTPPGYPDFELRVPAGTSPETIGKLSALPAAKVRSQPDYTARYRVRPGDTLSGIASKLGVTVAALQSANKVQPSSLKAGMWLTVPAVKTTSTASKAGSARAKKSAASSRSASARSASAGRSKPQQSGSGSTAKGASSPRSSGTQPGRPAPGIQGRSAEKGPPKELASR